ncbi:Aste57867_25398 [Aphanomyces stellatus]|uniref:Aste57867_25398 protein n=1 Tax=Aphanomyces stellatus TaxID=120398 RepID=A0A485LT25_9STRA|nr:hypothetical protein As57867_025319 [Aphanomyces stellatus]VFU02022.1 Aste57867_25398 [Aphanomyces stellatus]
MTTPASSVLAGSPAAASHTSTLSVVAPTASTSSRLYVSTRGVLRAPTLAFGARARLPSTCERNPVATPRERTMSVVPRTPAVEPRGKASSRGRKAPASIRAASRRRKPSRASVALATIRRVAALSAHPIGPTVVDNEETIEPSIEAWRANIGDYPAERKRRRLRALQTKMSMIQERLQRKKAHYVASVK